MKTMTVIGATAVALLIASCSTPKPKGADADGNPDSGVNDAGDGAAEGNTYAEALITSEGGEIALGGARLLVPAGALQDSQLITVRTQPKSLDPADQDMVGDVYDFQPDGLTFEVPAILSISHVDGELDSQRDELVLASKNAGSPEWTARDTWLTEDGVSAFIDHFTDWGKSKGFKMLDIPPKKHPCGNLVCGACDSCDSHTQKCLNQQEWAEALCETPQVPGGTCNLSCVCRSAPPRNCKIFNSKTCHCDKCKPGGCLGHPSFSGTITTHTEYSGNGTDVIVTHASVTFSYDTTRNGYRPSAGEVSSQWDRVNPMCTTHLTFAGAIKPNDGVLTFENGVYHPAGVSPARAPSAYTGTTTCHENSNEKMEQATTVESVVVWWQAPSSMALLTKPDGRLEDSFTEVSDTGTVQAQWSLVPDF